MPLTLSYIDDAWGLVTLVLNCSKKSRATTREDLVRTIEGFVNDYDRKERVVPGVTDPEPSKMTTGRTLTDTGVFQHVRCTNHRFECTTGITVDGRGPICAKLSPSH